MARNVVVCSESDGIESTMCVSHVKKPLLRVPRKKTKGMLCIMMMLVLFGCISILFIVYAFMIGDSNVLLMEEQEQQWHRNFFVENSEVKHSSVLQQRIPPWGCFSSECIEDLASSIARAFPMRDNRSSWCLTSPNEPNTGDSGIVLIKVPKGASSTSAGVAIRIATRQSCTQVHWRHRLASDMAAINSNKSFLFTTVREPAARAISSIFFHIVSRSNVEATDDFVIRQLNSHAHPHSGAISNGQGGFQLRYISFETIPENSAWTPEHPHRVLNPQQVVEHVRNVIQTYDFIIVPERMDESLVAMALLLNIDVADVLVSSSKVAGTSQYHLLHPNRTTFTCMSTARSFVSPSVAKHLQSDQWRAMNYGDYLLHAVAGKSLDLTIQNTIGYERFHSALNRYHVLQKLEQTNCAPYVQFPCSNDGKPQLQEAKRNCYLYYYDFGCGYPCIDKIIDEHDKEQSGS